MNSENNDLEPSDKIVTKHSKEEIIELLKEENPIIQGQENYSQLMLVFEAKKLHSNLGVIKGEYYQNDKLENRGSLLLPLDFTNQNTIWTNLKEGETAFYGFTFDSREMKVHEKVAAFLSRSLEGATIQDFIPFGGGKKSE